MSVSHPSIYTLKVRYVETGLRLADSSALDIGAINLVHSIYGTGCSGQQQGRCSVGETETDSNKAFLDPPGISARLEVYWEVDFEREIHEVWKRHLQMESYWVVWNLFPVPAVVAEGCDLAHQVVSGGVLTTCLSRHGSVVVTTTLFTSL